MKLRHATTRKRAAQIARQGFLVSKADPTAKIKGAWFTAPSLAPWGVLHTIRKHGAKLADVVVIEVEIPRAQLTKFKRGIWFSKTDIPASAIRGQIEGSAFGAGAQ